MSVKDACAKARISTSTYYKYKKKYDELGDEGLKNKEETSDIEARHLSIEQKAKIFDIIRENPDLGPKMISNTLNTEKYGFTQLSEKRIYDELIRMRLNTQEKRQAFVTQRTKSKRKFKLPGTPLLTMDGEVIKSSGSNTDSIVDKILQQRKSGETESEKSENTVSQD